MTSNGVPMPDHPSLDVAAALAPPPPPPAGAGDLNAPYIPLAGLHGAAGVTPGALPLLVRMPDGERRQIELPPTATVGDLRDKLPNDANWDFNFNGQQLDDDSTLASYNIPDAYGHAGGLLKMITDSGHLDTTQKAEILKNACNVVQHISRGETDMERLISAALDDTAPENNPPGSPTQPSLQAIRRGKRSFPSLNFANLPPPGPSVVRPGTAAAAAAAAAVAPPTPSQLIQKLSASRPDLYPPTTASRMLLDNPPTPSAAKLDASFGATTHSDPAASASATGLYNLPVGSPPAAAPAALSGPTNGEFKRVNTNTWFSEFAKNIAPLHDVNGPPDAPNDDAVMGDSEDDEPASTEPNKPNNTLPAPSSQPIKTEGATSSATDSYVKSDADRDPSAPQADTSDVASSAATPPSTKPSDSTDPGIASGDTKTGDAGSNAAAVAVGGNASHATAAAAAAPMPKKRGRKRKNPELSEEERKALRQAQNRASAKQSRLRRKEMAKEYEQRVTTLEGENEHLRDTVAALSDRLQFLQNLLTVSVQKRPPGPPPM